MSFFVAKCVECDIEVPFVDAWGRDSWAAAHTAVVVGPEIGGHTVRRGRADGPGEFVEDPDHPFLPVAGHPDDDECTHRGDGTDDTYCGRPEEDHGY